MELNAFVQIQEIIVSLGNITMEKDVFINQEHVLKEPHGMEPIVFLKIIVLQDFTP